MMRYLWILGLLVLTGCGAQSSNAEKSAEQVQKTLARDQFEIKFDKAMPMTSHALNQVFYQLDFARLGNSPSVIRISDQNSYVKFKKDTVSGDLPFYGEGYTGHYMNRHSGIKFDGTPEDFEKSEKDNQTRIKFNIRDEERHGEQYDISITIYKNGKATLHVNSMHRTSISYRGHLKIPDDLKENKTSQEEEA